MTTDRLDANWFRFLFLGIEEDHISHSLRSCTGTMRLASGYGQSDVHPYPVWPWIVSQSSTHSPSSTETSGTTCWGWQHHIREGAWIPESPPGGERLRIATYTHQTMKWARNKHFSKSYFYIFHICVSGCCFVPWFVFLPLPIEH